MFNYNSEELERWGRNMVKGKEMSQVSFSSRGCMHLHSPWLMRGDKLG